jgi:hypothetical protein
VNTLKFSMSKSSLPSNIMQDDDSESGDSHREQEEARRSQLLQLEQTLSGITTEHERLKAEYSSKISALATPALSKIEEYSTWIDKKCLNFANVLGQTNEGFQKELESLKDEMKSLVAAKELLSAQLGEMKLKDDERQADLLRMQQKLDTVVNVEENQPAIPAAAQPGAWIDNDLSSNIELIRVTKALHKALDMIDNLKKQNNANVGFTNN